MTRNIKLTIEYDGSNFAGWQIQAKGFRTVQDEITKVLRKIFKTKINLLGSGRTDSGVHALGQVAHFKTESTMPVDTIKRALNGNLPDEISILKAEEVPLKFHAQFSAKEKTYRYTILNRDGRCSLQRKFCLLYPYKLNLPLMRQEAKALVGRHDFKSFQAKDLSKKKFMRTVRTIKKLSIQKKGDYIYIDVTANGFLYKMVRNIVGTLLEIGCEKLPKGSIKKILSKKNRMYAGYTAKPWGLTLLEVKY